MFTGLVEETGTLLAVEQSADGARLTVTVRDGDALSFDLLAETLARTNLGGLAPGAVVNIERALAVHARLGGHFVQGHIDTTAQVLAFEPSGADHRLEITLPAEVARYVAFKGSIAIDGISLTVAEVRAESFVVWIIPHTIAMTNLRTRKAGEPVNLEFDLLAKYVERILAAR